MQLRTPRVGRGHWDLSQGLGCSSEPPPKPPISLRVPARYEDVYVDAWLYSDHQRYFFFQQLSTVGALLQLVVHGPGKYSMDESEGPVQVIALTSKSTD